jgi:putative DNA primase/helicase
MSIAIVTGRISNLIVVDLDRPDGIDGNDTAWIDEIKSQIDLPRTFTVRSGGWGMHFYYAYSWVHEIKNSTGLIDHVDIRGEGWYIIAPGSPHKSWNTYEIIDSNNSEKVDCPPWVHEKQSEEQKKTCRWKKFQGSEW